MDKVTRRDLRLRKAQLETRIRRLQQRGAGKERKQETRRKVLIGVLVLGWMARDEALEERVYSALNKLLVRPVDRAVFGPRLLGPAAKAGVGAHA